tara:strand:- start:810 stop:1385 length:576 start_codon:yes stop_codon:yes gene_type:complete
MPRQSKESQNTEWKESWHDDYLEWDCEFANAEGGRIYLGKVDAGTLPAELTIEQLFEAHESIPRNPLIAEVCYKAGYIDSWGRGVKKITEACKKADLPEPMFHERSGGFLVELARTPVKSEVKATQKSSEKSSEKILRMLSETPEMTIAELASSIGISTRGIEKNLKALQEKGKLRRIGPDKGGHWEVIDS